MFSFGKRPVFLPAFVLVALVPLQVGAETAGDGLLQAFSKNPAKQSAAMGFPTISLANLPSEARDTLSLIKKGGPFPYPKDGTVFGNREGLLPPRPRGYYKEYTVETPGRRDRGARRIVTGSDREYYYTEDHYRSFKLIKE